MLRRRPGSSLGAVAFAALAGCAQNPVTGTPDFVLISESQEIALGRRADQDVKKQYALYDLKGLQQYVESVGQKLARLSHRPGLEYRFTVLDSPEINAFALPGGHIYVTRGILAYLNSEAELAAVLGHEIGHVTARHSVRRISTAQGADILVQILSARSPAMRGGGAQSVVGLLGNALLAGYGREHELEADRLGAEYLARAGYDPQAMIRVVGVLKNQELFDAEIARAEGREPRGYHGVFATHPDNDTRLREVVGAAERLKASRIEDARDAYLARIDGMVFGDSPRQGFVRGGSFYHPELGIAVDLPAGWRAVNLPDRLIALAERGTVRLEMTVQAQPREAPAEHLRRLARVREGDIDATPINGLPAAVAMSRGRLYAAVYHSGKSYLFAGSGRSDAIPDKQIDAMRASVRSFRSLSERERETARPLLVRVIRVTAAERFSELAKRSPIGAHAEGTLRLINAMYPSGEPGPGETIKIVE